MLTATDADLSTTASGEFGKEGPEKIAFATFLGVVRLDGPNGAPGVDSEAANGREQPNKGDWAGTVSSPSAGVGGDGGDGLADMDGGGATTWTVMGIVPAVTKGSL